ncbi:MAG TPA: hypothetical protein VNA16_08155 [Abditibacteriaceae bacterium]|nr:hypothetical protein [Abditibacteriaceae bacterium]
MDAPTTSTAGPGQAAFARRGFYLHACWEFAYPFAVKSWQHDDYARMFALLAHLGFNTVMLWPLSEAVPPPLSRDDAGYLENFRRIITAAQEQGLECWLTQCANLTSRPEIGAVPLSQRHLYPFMHAVRLDDPAARAAYFQHRAAIQQIINNADGYVTIDGDPGGYPGAHPAEFLRVLQTDRATINRVGTHPERQKIIPWLWCGWGCDWEKNGPWNEPIEPLTTPVLEALKKHMTEPWELLPGRSIRGDWANGRLNFELTERAGLIERSTLLCYEIIEYEPTPPATVIQFDDIRRVLRQELRYASTARGCMGNAQQPIMALPNIYFFARALCNPDYLNQSDEQVLTDLAGFLGGPAELLRAAWECLRLSLEQIPPDLPDRLRVAPLHSEAAECLPGGPQRYLEILAQFVATRLGVLQLCSTAPDSPDAAADVIARAMQLLVEWWKVHHYVFSGELGSNFLWSFCHPLLRAPLDEWAAKYVQDRAAVMRRTARQLGEQGILPRDQAMVLMDELLKSR